MESLLNTFRQAYHARNGPLLSTCLHPFQPPAHPTFYADVLRGCPNEKATAYAINYAIIKPHDLPYAKGDTTASAWLDVLVAYWKVVRELAIAEYQAAALARADTAPDPTALPRWDKVYDAWKEVVNFLIRGYASAGFESWTISCLYVAVRWLRLFAIRADRTGGKRDASGAPIRSLTSSDMDVDAVAPTEEESTAMLEDAARQINRIFSLCVSDRAPLDDSRKWALYYVSAGMFKTYFRLGSVALARNILRSLAAAGIDALPLSAFPKSHACTFNYYSGVVAFLAEDYAAANTALDAAHNLCSVNATRNRAQILTYLILTRLALERRLPTPALLAHLHPTLQTLLTPLVQAIRSGNLQSFDTALEKGRPFFVKRQIYLTLERARELCLRNVCRKVFLAAGFDEAQDGKVRRTRIRVDEFIAGVRVSLGGEVGVAEYEATTGLPMDRDEVECLLAGLIYKGLMKGYISRERSMVVLSKGGAFPGTGV